MTEGELRSLIQKTESPGLECKQSLLTAKEIAEYAVGIGNSGGGYLVVGVTDKLPRQIRALSPEPSDQELERLQTGVADAAQIHIGMELVSTGEGRVLVVTLPARPRGIPFHTRDGKYLIRVGGSLRGMTPAEHDEIRREAGADLTRTTVPGTLAELTSPAAIEALRELVREARAPEEMSSLGVEALLEALEVYSRRDGLTLAGLLLVGSSDRIKLHAPFARWQFLHMTSDTDYDLSEAGTDCIPLALQRIRTLLAPLNPVVTLPGWLVQPELPQYPNLALRELLVNAFVHRDYAVPGSVVVKVHVDRLQISNPGGFVGGVSPANILHHPSAPRSPTLFMALTRMRLANAANLGVPRVYRELLREGKEPPIFEDAGDWVSVTVKGQQAKQPFVRLVHDHANLDVDDLLVIHFLTRHREIDAAQASKICQRPVEVVSEKLRWLAHEQRLLDVGGSGRATYYRLSRVAYELLLDSLSYVVDRRLTQENARARVLSALEQNPLCNSDIREITQLSRNQALTLMKGLEKEGLVTLRQAKRGSRWMLRREGA